MRQLTSGDVVDERFEVLFCAGVGGMGRVYRALDLAQNTPVALKVIEVAGDTNRERFAREVRLLSRLDHAHIVRYVAHGFLPDTTPYLAMEWVVGPPLSKRISGEPLTIGKAVTFAHKLSCALADAHARGIVHRDIKPTNILLEEGDLERPKLLDFGLARGFDATSPITRTGALVGTPAYMAPEQARRSHELDARADVFALGCVLFECITGYPAFRGPSVVAVLCKVLLEDPPWLGNVRGDVPEALSALTARMLAKNPDDRPRDAQVVQTALEELDLDGALARPARVSLGHHEQRYLSVILAGRPAHIPLSHENPTVAATPRLLSRMRKAVCAFDAQVAHLADSTVMLLLRGAEAASDRAARAARCALSVRELLPEVPIALATGRGVIRVEEPMGEVIDEAARLLACASDDALYAHARRPVLCDAVSASLLDARFELRRKAQHIELVAYRPGVIEPRKLLGRETPCVGRARELAILRAIWEESKRELVAHPVVITGPGGIGKTRLVREWLGELHQQPGPPSVFFARADSVASGGPFGMLAQLVRNAVGARVDEPPTSVRAGISRRVGALISEPGEAERLSTFLAELLGVSPAETESLSLRAARQDPVLRGDQIRRAFYDWLAAECRLRPVVVVLEDIQWGDAPSIEVMTTALRMLSEMPLCVVGLGRSEPEERFTRFGSERDATTLALGPLRLRASLELVRSVLPDVAAPSAEQIAKRSAGNPFFLEELIRAHASGRAERAPDNLLAMLHERLDELPSSLRGILRACSVFGDEFELAGVAALLDLEQTELGRRLDTLIERELLVELAGSGDQGRTLAFAQGLWREATYATLTERDRRLGHGLAAAWLEVRRPDQALSIAEHYQVAGNEARAGVWFCRAARHALEGGDHAQALARAERGIACDVPETRGELLSIQAEAHKWRGDNGLASERAWQALEHLRPGDRLWWAAAGEAAAASGKLGDRSSLLSLASTLLGAQPEADAGPAQGIALSRTCTQLVLAGLVDDADALLHVLARTQIEPTIAGWVFEARAIRAGSDNDPGARIGMAERAAEAFSRAGDLRNACLQLTSVGFALNEIGDYSGAEAALARAIELAERMGLSNAVSTAMAQQGRALRHMGQHTAAEATLRSAAEALRVQGNQRLEGVTRTYLAGLLLDSEHPKAAEQEARRALSALTDAPPLRAGAHAVLATVLLSLGRGDEALTCAEEAFEVLTNSKNLPTAEGLVYVARIETLLASGKPDEARSVVQEAHAHLQRKASGLNEEAQRQRLSQVPEHARIEARFWELCGDETETLTRLTP